MSKLGFTGLLGVLLIVPLVLFLLTEDIATTIAFTVFLTVIYLGLGIKVIIEYERGILFRFGKYMGVIEPGLTLIFPGIEVLRKVTTRIQVADVPPQEIISKDNIPLNINAVAYYKVENPEAAILNVEDYQVATFQIAQTTLRTVIGQHEMDEVLTKRESINARLKDIIDKDTDAWGISIDMVELKDVELPQNLKRAMAKQAEAERERRARVILATGEFEASGKLSEAGDVMIKHPGALQLRLLQTIQEVSVEKNSTILFPFPLELTELFKKMAEINKKDK